MQRGKLFLLFGDGSLTACKPISDGDLAEYLADCLEDPRRWNRVLPIGGPGEVIAPRHRTVPCRQGGPGADRRYYATESMLLLNPDTGRYDAAATPTTGTETLFDYHKAVQAGVTTPERGDHAVF